MHGKSVQAPKIFNTTNMLRMTKVFSAFMLVFLFFSSPVLAELTPGQQAQIDAYDTQNRQLESQLNSLYAQERTIANEIAIVEAQASALQAQINNTFAKINITNEQISITNSEIARAEAELARQKITLQEYLKTMYINGQTSQIELILTSNNFSDFIDQSEYLNTMQNNIQMTMNKITETKKILVDKKISLETSKAELDVLKEGQISQQNALNSQIALKARLLDSTQTTQDDLATQIALNDAQSAIIRYLSTGGGGSANGDLKIVNQYPYFAQNDVPGTYDGYHSYAFYGCLITSLAMSHGLTPQQEAANHTYDGWGNMNTDSTSGTLASWSSANKSLSRGGKVIMQIDLDGDGLGDHFVLAIGFVDGKYLINDPYRGLSPSYSKSQVTKLLNP